MRKLHFLLLVFIVLVYSCEDTITSFQSTNFIKFFGGGEGSNGASGLVVPGEGYIFSGYNVLSTGRKQIYAAKTDLYGNIVWDKLFNSDSIQECSIIKQFDNDNLLLIGSSKVSSTGNSMPFIFKIDMYGDSIWKRSIDVNYNLLIHDFLYSGDNIFLVGESYKNSTSLPDTYIAKLNINGDLLNSVTKGNVSKSEIFTKVFIKSNGDLVVFGNSNLSSSVTLVTVNEFKPSSLSVSSRYEEIGAENSQELKDVILVNNSYFLLVYESVNNSKHTKIIKLNSDYSKAWETESISNFEGKSITIDTKGILFVAGEHSSQIQFIKIDPDGNAYYGDAVFKTYPGSVGQILNTTDNGLLIVGSTPSVYSNMIQLIKTGSDLYLLKP
ncbi:MAG: hypothetical protein AB7S48_05020 [Bacteroidales bacterium]